MYSVIGKEVSEAWSVDALRANKATRQHGSKTVSANLLRPDAEEGDQGNGYCQSVPLTAVSKRIQSCSRLVACILITARREHANEHRNGASIDNDEGHALNLASELAQLETHTANL